VLYIGLKRGTEEEFVELDSKGQVIGIEILNASKVLKPVIKPFQKQILEPAVR
jgi:uncharacterized protein YuzE